MIFAESRFPLFGIMLELPCSPAVPPGMPSRRSPSRSAPQLSARRSLRRIGADASMPHMARTASDSPLLFDDLPVRPDFGFEERLHKRRVMPVAGVDEVGRGPIAGPVVAAAVILDPDSLPDGLDDSKRLTASKRNALFEAILGTAHAVSVASLCAQSIDRTDIRKASLEAMRRAVAGLTLAPAHILVDGNDLPPGLFCPASALVRGDQRSMSIAAASIVAKVTRDRMMARAGGCHPAFGLERHVGYSTEEHLAALALNGPVVRLHRYSFSPIRED